MVCSTFWLIGMPILFRNPYFDLYTKNWLFYGKKTENPWKVFIYCNHPWFRRFFFVKKMLKIRISQHLRFSQSLIIREILFTLFKNSAYHVLIWRIFCEKNIEKFWFRSFWEHLLELDLSLFWVIFNLYKVYELI